MGARLFSIQIGCVHPRLPGCAVALAILAFAAITGRAQDGLLTQKSLEDAPAGLEGGIKALGDKGALFQFNYWGEAFANLSGGVRRGGDYEGLLKISLNLDLRKLVQWNGATIYASMLYPHGNGITDQYVNDYNVLSNIDAYDSVRLFEFWFQQTFFDGRFSIRLGQLTTDNDFFVSNNSALFINSALGTIGTVLHDVVAPIYPVGSQGIRLHYDFTPSFYVQAMAMDDNAGAQNLNDKRGTQSAPIAAMVCSLFTRRAISPIRQTRQAAVQISRPATNWEVFSIPNSIRISRSDLPAIAITAFMRWPINRSITPPAARKTLLED